MQESFWVSYLVPLVIGTYWPMCLRNWFVVYMIFPVSLAWVLAWISWDFAWGLEYICEDYNFLSMSYLWVISFSILGKGLLSSIVYVPKVFTWIHGSSKKVFLKIFVWPKNFYVAQTFLWRRKTFCGQI